MSEERRYFAADAEFNDELERTRLREREMDPATIRRFMALGVSQGWRCLEVGGGGGSIARWLADRVGTTGKVVVIDIDTKFLKDLALPNLEVRCQDITRDEPEVDTYDLVHCRAVLMHLADPEATLGRLTKALRPGGWVFVEECDGSTWTAVDNSNRLVEGHDATVHRIFDFWKKAAIIDPFLGRWLPELFSRVGLIDIGNEGVARIIRGGSPWAQYMEKTFQRTDEAMLKQGALNEREIADRRRALQDPTFYFRDLLVDACWGRRPV